MACFPDVMRNHELEKVVEVHKDRNKLVKIEGR